MRGGVFLCFSATAGSSGSTSVYCQPTRAHRVRAPAGSSAVACDARHRERRRDPRSRASLHYLME